MKHLLTKDIEGADWGRIIANEAEDTVYLKGFEFGFVSQSQYNPIDLGLSVKWSDRNIGANSPEDSGLYFQWGDTIGYSKEQIGVDKEFTWEDYKLGTEDNPAKYNDSDGKTVLDLEDDAAHVLMGGDWRLPTKEELEELFSLEKKFVFQTRQTTSSEWGEPIDYSADEIESLLASGSFNVDGKGNWIEETSTIKFLGIKFIGKNGNELYVPAVELIFNGSLMNCGNMGYLWTSSLYPYAPSCAIYGGFNYKGENGVVYIDRCGGLSLRGVVGSQSLPHTFFPNAE